MIEAGQVLHHRNPSPSKPVCAGRRPPLVSSMLTESIPTSAAPPKTKASTSAGDTDG
jgi:hypothetical protein